MCSGLYYTGVHTSGQKDLLFTALKIGTVMYCITAPPAQSMLQRVMLQSFIKSLELTEHCRLFFPDFSLLKHYLLLDSLYCLRSAVPSLTVS